MADRRLKQILLLYEDGKVAQRLELEMDLDVELSTVDLGTRLTRCAYDALLNAIQRLGDEK